MIRSLLSLPSGYWDHIYNYQVYYKGQTAVDFTSSSSTNAITNTALEQDAILVLCQYDLTKGGVSTLGVEGYGEHLLDHLDNDTAITNSASQTWKEYWL